MTDKYNRKIKKIAYWFSGTILLFIIITSILIYAYLPKYLHSELTRLISDKTNQQYELTLDKININIVSQSISLESIELKSTASTTNHYYFLADRVHAKQISIFNFLTNKELSIKSLEFTNPVLELYGENGEQKASIEDEELVNVLQPFFAQTLKFVSIQNIEFSDAKMSQFRLDSDNSQFYTVKTFNIGITNFYIDSTLLAQRNEYFQADDIFLNIQDFNRLLGDSLHQLQMDEITYSIKKKSILGNNIRLLPIDTTNASYTYYWVNVPEMSIKSENIREIFDNDTIKIDSLFLRKSDIRIKPPQEGTNIKLSEISEFDLYRLIQNDFHLIAIHHLSFEGDRMRIESRTPDDKLYQEFDQLIVDVDEFQLDSLSNRNPQKILYSNQIHLEVGSYTLQLSDKIHQFKTSNIFASSKDSIIKTEQLELTTVDTTANISTEVNMQCDSIRLLNIDFAWLYHHREIPLEEIAAFNPKLIINQHKKSNDKKKNNNSLLYEFIRDYIKGVYANRIEIRNGKIAVNDLKNKADKGRIETNFNLKLADFSLDSSSVSKTDKLFYANEIELSLKDYSMNLVDQLHQLKVDQINISTIQQYASFQNIHLFPEIRSNAEKRLQILNKSQLFDITIPSLVLRNTDIHHAFFKKSLHINSLEIEKPDFYLEIFANNRIKEDNYNPDEFYELLNSYIAEIEVETIKTTDGQFRFVNHSKKGKTIDFTNNFNLELYHFLINDRELQKDRLLFSDYFELALKDHLFKLSDNVHYVQAKEINLSSKESSISINNALLYPDITSSDYKDMPWHLQVNIPKIKLENVNLHKAYFEKILEVGNFAISPSTVKIYRNGVGSDKFNFKDIAVPLPPEIESIFIKNIDLENGDLKIYTLSGYNQTQIAESKVDLQVENARLEKKPDSKTARFTSSNIETRISQFHLTPQNVPYLVDVDSIYFSSTDKQLKFSQLDIQAINDRDDLALIRLQIPTLSFEELEPTNAFQNNRFHSKKIYFKKPIIQVNQVEGNSTTNPLLIKLPKDLLHVMDEISSEQVVIESANFKIYNESQTILLNNIDFDLEQFRLDSTLSEKPLGADDLSVSLSNYEFSDENNLYNFSIERIFYSGSENALDFSRMNIDPIFTKEEFQKAIHYQTDYYSGDIDSIRIKNLDLNRWLSKQELLGSQIIISKANIDIYRDKRTVFNENQYRPLPQQIIKDIDYPFYFDSLLLKSSNISYSEQIKNVSYPGIVNFDNLNGKVYPFTNSPLESEIKLIASARLMNSSNLNVDMTFDLNSPSFQFDVSGSLSPFDITALNPITKSNAQILVRSGKLNRFEFDFSADTLNAKGKLRFAYDDLKISILEQKNGNTKEVKFASFMANSLMLKSKNPRTRILLPDEINFERDPKRSIINYWWKTIFSGAKNTFGLKEDK